MNNIRAAVLVALAVGVTCNDLKVGTNYGRIVFNETVQASPTIWRQSQQVTVNVSDQEIISSVLVTDNRSEKDGEATIIEGGEGKQKVVIELKSPTVFRGFDFHIVVYAAEKVFNPMGDAQHPAVMTKDFDLNVTAKPEDAGNVVNVPTKDTKNGPIPPVLLGGQDLTDLLRKSRNTPQPDPVVKVVTQKALVDLPTTTEVTTTETFAETTENAKVNTVPVTLPVDQTTKVNNVKVNEHAANVSLYDIKTPNVPAILPKVDLTTEDNVKVNQVPKVHRHDVKSTTSPSTTIVADVTTEKTHEEMKMQNFDSISKELGQKVIFGIKKH